MKFVLLEYRTYEGYWNPKGFNTVEEAMAYAEDMQFECYGVWDLDNDLQVIDK